MPKQFRWALSTLTLMSLSLLGAPLVANAADLAPAPVYKAPPAPPPPPPFSWTGFYIGGNLGAGWGRGEMSDSLGIFDNFGNMNNNATFIGGGQVGANYQFNWLVIGVEGDFDWVGNNNNNNNGVIIDGHTFDVTGNNRWLTTLAGRVGVAWDHWLFYGKGGGAWVGNHDFTITDVTTNTSVTGFNNNNSGWVAGGGIEWAVTNNWTVRAEYDYIGLESRNFFLPANAFDGGAPPMPPPMPPANDLVTVHDRNIQTFTVGVNYLFNWGYNNAVAASY